MGFRQNFAPITIVGAGPAGATAARTLAAAGVPVRLLDRAAFPRNKPCGGGISTRVLRRFPYLERALGRIATHAVSRLHLEGPDGESTLIESAEAAALMIRRTEFDALLVALAVEAGAELITEVDVVHAAADRDGVELTARDGRRFSTPLLIVADGVNSRLARRLGFSTGWPPDAVALDMMEETPRSLLRDVDPSALWVAYGYDPECRPQSADTQRTAEGYAYIFPKRDHVNIGIGYVLSYYRGLAAKPPYERQRDLIAALKSRGLVTGESVRRNFTPFHIPVAGPLPVYARGRVLLAGDAGGFVNAFTAEGIYYAMVTGDLAARAALAGPGEEAGVARRYRRACRREIGRELVESVLIQRYLFADRRRMAHIIRNAHRQGKATRAILEYATGRRSYASVRFHLLSRFPRLAFRLMWEGARDHGWSRRSSD